MVYRRHGVSHNAGAADAEAVDAHALVLFMFAQVYVRRHNAATQQPALDVWPQQSAPAEAAAAEPGSPKARTNHTGQQDKSTRTQSLQHRWVGIASNGAAHGAGQSICIPACSN